MSEPVIKATGARWCPKCRHASHGNAFGAPWMHCSFDDVDTVELYTRDDLVRAVEAAMVAANYSGDIKGHATRVVDRLTKGNVSIKKRKGLPQRAMQNRKSQGQHVWEQTTQRCIKCLMPYHSLWVRHWNPRMHKPDWCVRPSRPSTVTIEQLKRILGGAR